MSNNKTFEVYCLQLCGKSYRVKVGHIDEFLSLFREQLEVDEATIYGTTWDSSINYHHPYQWYRLV